MRLQLAVVGTDDVAHLTADHELPKLEVELAVQLVALLHPCRTLRDVERQLVHRHRQQLRPDLPFPDGNLRESGEAQMPCGLVADLDYAVLEDLALQLGVAGDVVAANLDQVVRAG